MSRHSTLCAFLKTTANGLKCMSSARAAPSSKVAPSTVSQVSPGLAVIIESSGAVEPVNGRVNETGFRKVSPCGSSKITSERSSSSDGSSG
jgi:hypothetical protein